jgi:hypothetical protein
MILRITYCIIYIKKFYNIEEKSQMLKLFSLGKIKIRY